MTGNDWFYEEYVPVAGGSTMSIWKNSGKRG